MRIAALLAASLLASPALPEEKDAPDARVPVLLELFTSEGCSSCPPADALVAALVREQPLAGVELIALEEHVDYWDNLGWRDPFSQHVFAERQTAQLEAMGKDALFTPQAVLDGRDDAVGSNRAGILEAARAAAREPHGKLELRRLSSGQLPSGDKLLAEVRASGLPPGEATLYVALVEEGLQSEPTRGENAGRKLPHAAVVRAWVRVASGEGALQGRLELPLEPSWRAEKLRLAAFAETRAHRILASAIER